MFSIDVNDILEGTMRRFELDSKSIMVAKVRGNIYAISDRCTHLGCRLSGGTLEGTIVSCPCHATKFDISNGKVVEYVGDWPRIMQKAASLLIRDVEVFNVSISSNKAEVSK